jgi:predicted hydrocarbon binding protein
MQYQNKSDYQIAQQKILDSIFNGEFDIENRENLGPLVPIRLFQVLRMVALGSNVEDMLGDGAPALVYHSGQGLGQVLGQTVVDQADKNFEAYVGQIEQICRRLSIGLLVPETIDMKAGIFELRVDECVSCAGIHDVSAPICHFEAGMVGGIFKAFFNKNVKATETKCNALGDDTCLINVKLF